MDNINTQFANLFLDRLKIICDIRTDYALAKHLGTSQSTISSWRSRNSFDLNLIIAKCEVTDYNFLFTGIRTNDGNSKAYEPPPEYGCRICKEKDKLLASKDQVISSLTKALDSMQVTIETLKGEYCDQGQKRKAG